MARHIWQSDFAHFWFGFRSSLDSRMAAGRVRAGGEAAQPDGGPLQTPDRPLGIVERNRRAQREKWALRR